MDREIIAENVILFAVEMQLHKIQKLLLQESSHFIVDTFL